MSKKSKHEKLESKSTKASSPSSKKPAKGDVLPRPKRQKRRARSDRGLPPDEDVRRLAIDYLENQTKMWPQMAKAGLLPAASDESLDAMVDDFKYRHRTGQFDPKEIEKFLQFVDSLGGNYDRYSCDNSSPTSINDQLVNSLQKAREDDCFIPWSYVFCDYSVSGLDAGRQGYGSYKKILNDPKHLISTTYIDEFTRASRDELEWWRLAALCKRLGKRMVGASDDFDLSNSMWDIQITLFGLLSRLFLKGLREKVRRGMKGTARRRGSLGKPPLGFTRCVLRDEHGDVVLRPDERPRHFWCVDRTRRYVILIFKLFVEKRWSMTKIARRFNEKKVEGSDGWTQGSIRKILTNEVYLGVFIWNRRRTEFDWEQEKYVTIENPRSEWIVEVDRDRAIIPPGLWKAAQRRLHEIHKSNPLTGRSWSRNQHSASTLFSGTLVCGSCGREILLTRSTNNYKMMGCPNGISHVQGCKLHSSKSTRIIEDCLLTFLRNAVLTEDRVEDLVKRANEFLKKQPAPKTVSVKAIKSRMATIQRKIRNLLGTVAGEDDPEIRARYHAEVKTLQAELNAAGEKLNQQSASIRGPIAPLDAKRIVEYLDDLRALLNQEIPRAAEVIRSITGTISVTQKERTDGKRGAVWIASFAPNLLQVLGSLASENNYPDSLTLEYLITRNWIVPEPVELEVRQVPPYEKLAAEVQARIRRKISRQNVATMLGISPQLVDKALKFAETGERPGPKKKSKTCRPFRPAKYKEIAEKVRKLRDEGGESFTAIAGQLGVGRRTVVKAYDYARPDIIKIAIESESPPNRDKRSRLSVAQKQRILAEAEKGTKKIDITKIVGCSIQTVYRTLKGAGGHGKGRKAS